MCNSNMEKLRWFIILFTIPPSSCLMESMGTQTDGSAVPMDDVSRINTAGTVNPAAPVKSKRIARTFGGGGGSIINCYNCNVFIGIPPGSGGWGSPPHHNDQSTPYNIVRCKNTTEGLDEKMTKLCNEKRYPDDTKRLMCGSCTYEEDGNANYWCKVEGPTIDDMTEKFEKCCKYFGNDSEHKQDGNEADGTCKDAASYTVPPPLQPKKKRI